VESYALTCQPGRVLRRPPDSRPHHLLPCQRQQLLLFPVNIHVQLCSGTGAVHFGLQWPCGQLRRRCGAAGSRAVLQRRPSWCLCCLLHPCPADCSAACCQLAESHQPGQCDTCRRKAPCSRCTGSGQATAVREGCGSPREEEGTSAPERSPRHPMVGNPLLRCEDGLLIWCRICIDDCSSLKSNTSSCLQPHKA
jgi:hypothetical protein